MVTLSFLLTQTVYQPVALQCLYKPTCSLTKLLMDLSCARLHSFVLCHFTLLTEQHPVSYCDIQGLPKPVLYASFTNYFIYFTVVPWYLTALKPFALGAWCIWT